MTPEQEEQFDVVHAHVPTCAGLATSLGINPDEIAGSLRSTIRKYNGDPADVAAHAFRLGTIMGYLYAQKEATASDKRNDA